MSGKTLTVIVPNFNDGDHVAKSLRAICEQSFPPHELIVVDDGSTDDSISVIKEFAEEFPFVRLICNETNRGIVFSANRALKQATGDYVYIASANDLVLPGFFEKSLELLAEYPRAGFCCSDAVCINVVEDNAVTESRTRWLDAPGYLSPTDVAKLTRSGKGLYHPITNTCILKRELLSVDGLWDQRVGCYCDWLLHQALLFRYGCCFIPEPLTALRWTGSSMSSRVNSDLLAYRQIMQELIPILASPDYQDIARLIIFSQSFRAFQLEAFTPFFLWSVLRAQIPGNPYAMSYLLHLLVQHIRYRIKYTGARIFLSDLPSNFFSEPARLSKQQLIDLIISWKYYLGNIWDRVFARSFHNYDRLRSCLRLQLGINKTQSAGTDEQRGRK